MIRIAISLCLTMTIYLSTTAPAVTQEDPEFQSMPDGEGKDFVYLVCADCHSMSHVLQKRYSRSAWRGALKRMTTDFGMAELDRDETALVLDYLTQASK